MFPLEFRLKSVFVLPFPSTFLHSIIHVLTTRDRKREREREINRKRLESLACLPASNKRITIKG